VSSRSDCGDRVVKYDYDGNFWTYSHQNHAVDQGFMLVIWENGVVCGYWVRGGMEYVARISSVFFGLILVMRGIIS
jgi:predicted NAD/FAD-dependent oxidoreductase